MNERKILVVDDEEPVRDILQEAFAQENYTVFTAADAQEALAILKKENILVMFLDLKLPGMDGVELCRKIRQTKPIAVIHAITGYASLFELTDCLESGFNDYFIKPVKLNLLYKAAADAFEKIDRWCKKVKHIE